MKSGITFAYGVVLLQTRYHWKVDSDIDLVVKVFFPYFSLILFCRPLKSDEAVFSSEGISFDSVIYFSLFLWHWKVDFVLYIDMRSFF